MGSPLYLKGPDAPSAPPPDDWFAQYGGHIFDPTKASPNGGFPGPTAAPTQDWNEQSFAAQFGTPRTPQELIALEQQLQAAGIKVLRNAEGVAGKIQLPNGQIVDVINAAGAGGRGFQWLTGEGGGGAGGYGSLMQDYGQQFKLPTQEEFLAMPGTLAALAAGQQAVERGAAARGTLLTGGTQKALQQNAIDIANQKYAELTGLSGQAFDRNHGVWDQDRKFKFGALSDLAKAGRPT